jgi:hypothetical protein
MTAGSGDGATDAGGDIRDCVGYAIREVYVGQMGRRGRFHDWIQHHHSGTLQTQIYVSSTDPWHRASDRDPNVEQPGFDRVFHSGLTCGAPALIPVPMLYSTPENAVSELRWLKQRGYPVAGLELGEEPDGQYVSPIDFGALYVQWVRALRQVDAHILIGGPSFQNADVDVLAWPIRPRSRTWLQSFVDYVRWHGCFDDIGFVSFEWYPFDDICSAPAPKIQSNPGLLDATIRRLRSAGLPQGTPLVISEYGYSAFAARAEVDLPGALFDVDTAARFVQDGGAMACFFGYEPGQIMQEHSCPANPENAWGNLALLLSDDQGQAHTPVAAYYAARLLTGAWAGMSTQACTFVDAGVTGDRNARRSLSVYAIRRPDGRLAVVLMNKGSDRPLLADVRVAGARLPVGHQAPGTDDVDLYQYGPAQYHWKAAGEQGHPDRDLPPAHRRAIMNQIHSLIMPPLSITVLVMAGPREGSTK